MVYIRYLVWILPVARSAAAYGSNRPAKISLFEASNITEPYYPSDLDCGTGRLSTDITLPLNTCLWGDYSLINNLKITSLPNCAYGEYPVAYFYSTTSCTGNPTFRSDKAAVKVEDKCLFGSSPAKWSMIFRCDNLESQAVAKGYYVQAIPPNYSSYEKPAATGPKASDGVVTPHFTYDCTTWKPKEPTFLPTDTCLTVDIGHSVFINQPATCASGKAAIVQSFAESGCKTSIGWLGTDAFSSQYGTSLDKKCHTTQARSIKFHCGDKEMQMFEDLPPHKPDDVEPLVILAPRPKPKVHPFEPNQAAAIDQKLEGYIRSGVNPDGTKSAGTKWSEYSATPLRGKHKPAVTVTPKSTTIATPMSGKSRKPIVDLTPQSLTPQGGKIQPYYLKDCKNDQRSNTASMKAVDTCVWTFMYESMQVKSPAVCTNGTRALFATYSRPGCKPEEMTSFGELPEVYSEGCADISSIDSFAFWCEGLPASEIGNKGSIGGFFKMLLIVILVVVLMIALSILSCCLRGAAMMKQANELWGHIMRTFGKREGAIQL
jgi:hypothetical protein